MNVEHDLRETRDSILYVRLTQSVRDAIDEWAREEKRATSSQVAMLIEQAIKARAQRNNGKTK